MSTSEANSLDDEQPDQDDYQLVTENTRIQQRLRPTRSQADRIEVWTREVADSNDSVRVRIQRDDDGSPIDVSSRSADIVHADIDPGASAFGDGGYSVFYLDDHSFHDQDPWLIIEATGANGQEIAITRG